MRDRIEDKLGALIPVDGGRLDGEARLYRLYGGQGDVGFISSVTEPFCASCNRARLTADGKLRMCLLREYEMDLLTPLRAGAGMDELKALITKAVYRKPWGHGLAHNIVPMNRVMSEIGG
jgi:cyclic pyranopterin phosphate synthase